MSQGRRSRAVPVARLLLLVLAGVTGWGAVTAAGGTGHALGMTLAGPPAPTASTAPAAQHPSDDATAEGSEAVTARRERAESASRSQVRLDPRFAGCSRASAAGFGPYQRGRDPEYAWYPDDDRDGVACEELADQVVDAGL